VAVGQKSYSVKVLPAKFVMDYLEWNNIITLRTQTLYDSCPGGDRIGTVATGGDKQGELACD